MSEPNMCTLHLAEEPCGGCTALRERVDGSLLDARDSIQRARMIADGLCLPGVPIPALARELRSYANALEKIADSLSELRAYWLESA